MPVSDISSLLLVGAGKMGGAMLAGWLGRGLDPAAVTVVDPRLSPEMDELARRHGFRAYTSVADVDRAPALVVLAVKPQQMQAALPDLARRLVPDTVVVSIAAGTRIASLAAALGERPIVRVMPNTPAQVGAGMSVAVGNGAVDAAIRAQVTALTDAVGATAWVDDEAQIDAVTALSGSGPAYVFHLVEAMAAAGERAGLPADLAMRLARQTVVGGGALLAASDLDAATLRQNVTSPAGTTAAALAVLMGEAGFGPLLERAVAAAADRSRELAG